MNATLQKIARQKIKEGLSQCSEDQQRLFKQIFAFENIESPIEEVVDVLMSEDDLDSALTLVERTIARNQRTI
jgi:hypothetical protein